MVEKLDLDAARQTFLNRLFGLWEDASGASLVSFAAAHFSFEVLFSKVLGLGLFLTGCANFALLVGGTGELAAVSSLSLKISPSSRSVSERFEWSSETLSARICASWFAGEPGYLFSLFTSSFFELPSPAEPVKSAQKKERKYACKPLP